MQITDLFYNITFNKIELNILNYIQENPEKCLKYGIRNVARECYSSPSSIIRLAKKLNFSGWLELVYFIKFNVTMPKVDATSSVDFMNIYPETNLQPLMNSLREQRILIHGSGFSQLIAQYIYNKFLVLGVNASLALWADYEILEQKTEQSYDAIWLISKSGRSSSLLRWIKSLENKNVDIVCFTGDCDSPLTKVAQTSFIIHDPQKYDDDIYWSNPFFGYCILGFEHFLKLWFQDNRLGIKPNLD